MILGDVCTRNCGFCAISNGPVKIPDQEEPRRVAEAAAKLKLLHVVITSVTRDDLPDGGALQFCETIKAIREALPGSTIEVLTPDFDGRGASIDEVCDAGPDIFNHNVETVESLTGVVRSGRAGYQKSLRVLERVKERDPNLLTKSGLMVGLGEQKEEVLATLRDLRNCGCDIVTIGQYLQPSDRQICVKEFIRPDEFEQYKREGRALGFKEVFCGPFVRSSYHAGEITNRILRESEEDQTEACVVERA